MGEPQFVISSLIDGYLGYFQFEVIMNKAAIDILCRSLCGYKFSNQLSKTLQTDVLGKCKNNLMEKRQSFEQICWSN